MRWDPYSGDLSGTYRRMEAINLEVGFEAIEFMALNAKPRSLDSIQQTRGSWKCYKEGSVQSVLIETLYRSIMDCGQVRRVLCEGLL